MDATATNTTPANQKLSLGNRLAFATGDIFGGGTFNLINFLFIPFLTLVLGIPMIWASPLLLLTKLWDGIIDPFIGAVTDGKKPGRLGKRRYFMLIAAPVVFVALVLLFFPWNLVTDSLALKIVLVALCYILYATAQSFVLIPYYGLASEMTGDFTERNKVNAIRLAFSIVSSLVCVAVPGMIASPTGSSITNALNIDSSYGYIIMSCMFGLLFAAAIIITALCAREQIVSPPVRRKVTLKNFFKPLKSKTYCKYLGMYMCASMAMAVMSSFFFIYCDFVLRADSYALATAYGYSRFPIATVAAACMFAAQVLALPIYLNIIKKHGKKTAYTISGILWCTMAVVMLLLPGETAGSATVTDGYVTSNSGVGDIMIMLIAFLLGISVGGCVFVPHSCFGDVCDACQLQFEERTEGNISGLTNLLNTTAQAVGLALPPLIMSIAVFGGYVETQYITLTQYNSYLADSATAIAELGMALENFAVTIVDESVRLIPLLQSDASQLALRITFSILPLIVVALGVVISRTYKLSESKQRKIRQLIEERDTMDIEQYEQQKDDMVNSL